MDFPFTNWTEAEGRRLHGHLRDSGQRVAAAESLTVGRVQTELGRFGGASAFFVGGATCYSVGAKIRLLGVDAAHAMAVDGVSERVVGEMARGVAAVFGADWGLATTGYAEPGAEAAEGPPFAWVAVARGGAGGSVRCLRVEGPGRGREEMQALATAAVLRLLAAECGLAPDPGA
jgi:nicotinamide-nucleotide amidase